MDIRSLRSQTLTSHSHCRSICPSFNKFNLRPSITQPKFWIPSKALLVYKDGAGQWSIGLGSNVCWGKDRTLESCAFASSAKRRGFKALRRQGPSSANRNSDRSVPGEDNPEEKNESDRSADAAQLPNLTDLDWRAFRARLFIGEQAQKLTDGDSGSVTESSISFGPKWAHPLHTPESGCVLVATEKLDGTRSFERTVILLLRAGSNDPREGPFGVILNRPLQRSIRDMKPTNPDLATTFADCPLHFGGPLEASMFLLMAGNNVVTDFEEVIPGLCYGARNSLHRAAELVKSGVLQPQNFKFFLGYSGWEMDQLKEEIALNYWHMAACSPDLITTASVSSSTLWEEILLLMGGQYAELSRKPKQDGV